MRKKFFGFQRKDNRVGIRNYVAVISVMDIVNPIAAKIARNVRNTVLVSDLFGRRLEGIDHEQRFRTLYGISRNPNVGAVLLVGLHSASTIPLAEAISAVGKEVEVINFQDIGSTLVCIEKGLRFATNMVKKCSQEVRTPQPISTLRVGVECGGSDASSGIAGNPAIGNAADRILREGGTVLMSETAEVIGAEHLLAKRAVSETVAEKLLTCIRKKERMAQLAGVPNIRDSNPSFDNKKGGITTLEEKSLGAILKAGSQPLLDVLQYAEALPDRPGFYFMDTPAPACESMTGMSASGVQLILFNTGQGNPIASPVSPTLKLTGNPVTAGKNRDDLDLDVSGIISKGIFIEQAGERVFNEIIAVANGKMPYSEILDITQSAIGVLGPSF